MSRYFCGLVVIALGFVAVPCWAVGKDWNDGTDNWSNGADWTPAGVPGAGDNAHIVFGDGVARTVTYDYAGPAITLGNVSIDLTGAGTDASTLTMAAGNLTTNLGQSIGSNGRGTFNQSGGTNSLSTLALRLGDFAGSTGVYNLSGTGVLAANIDEIFGYSGTGSFNQSGGTNTISGADEHLYVGVNGGTGNYTLTGGSLSAGVNENVGYFGTGNFDHSAGTNFVADTLDIGVLTTATGTYTLSGSGQLTTNNLLRVGNAGNGTFGQTGGTNNTAALTVGAASTALGTYTLTAGTLVVSGSEVIAANATGDGTQSGGTFQQSAGTHQVNTLTLAAGAASNGTFTLGGGSLVSAASETIGSAGTATFTQSGGVNTAPTIVVGASSGSTGTYSLNGGSTNATNIYVGGSAGGAGGAGVFNVSGSSTILTVPGTIKVYNTQGTSFNLQSGTANVGAINVGGVASRFNWSGGTLNIMNDLALDAGAAPDSTSAAFGSSLSLGTRILKVTGNETIGGAGTFALSLSSNSSGAAAHAVTGNVTLKPGGSISSNTNAFMTYGSLTQAGGSISGSTFRNTSNFIYQSGSFTTTLVNDGTVAFGSSFSVSGLTNETSLTVGAGQLLSVGFNGTINSGNVVINAGSLTFQNQFTNTGTVTMTAGTLQAIGTGTLTNSGLLVVNGGTAGGSTTNNSGTLVLNGGTLSTSTFTNLISGTLTGHGTISNTLVNHGTITVDGSFTLNSSFITQDGILQGVGTIANQSGSSTFSNSAGGVINSITPNGALTITNFSTNNAGATINVGPTSTLSLSSNSSGTGSWTNTGIVNLQGPGARLSGGPITLQNGGALQGAGLVTASMGSSNTGVIRASGGELDFSAISLTISSQTQVQVLAGSTINFMQGVFTNSGTISLFGGTYENSGRTISNNGTINGYGTLRTGGLTNGSGRLISVGEGNMDVVGSVTNNGVISIQSGRTAYFFNNVSGSGSFTGTGTAVFLASLSPGNSPAQVNFAGGATLGGGTSLNMELGGNTVGTGYDKIDVEGQLSIGGALSVSLINGFTPAAWTTFDLLDWGTLAGTFSSLSLPTLTVGQWDTSKLYVDGTISVTLAGDFDHSGAVNAADYVVWRKGLGTIYSQSDFDLCAHFGDGGGSGSGSAVSGAAVPEPSTAMLWLVAAVFAVFSRGLRRGLHR